MTQNARSHRAGRINAVLVAGGQWHDIDFARLELLKLLAEEDRVRVRVFEDFENLDALGAADFLVSYTCNVTPSLAAQQGLRSWLESGGRWYALHGTNSILRAMDGGRQFDTPNDAPLYIDTLGTLFKAHPPIQPFTVDVADPDHPLVDGLRSFQVNDEQYLVEIHGELHVLLDTEFEGKTPGFPDARWTRSRHPVFYIKSHGAGAVLYLTLGHCRHHYDLQPMLDWWPTVDRCAWELPQYYELLRRGLRWAIEPVDAATAAARKKAQSKPA